VGAVDHAVLDLFPDSARIDGAALTLGGLTAEGLAAEFDTPLVVYCEETLRARARSLRAVVPGGGHIAFGTKAFSNVAVL
jgi:diaminopimelate decarboxylase